MFGRYQDDFKTGSGNHGMNHVPSITNANFDTVNSKPGNATVTTELFQVTNALLPSTSPSPSLLIATQSGA